MEPSYNIFIAIAIYKTRGFHIEIIQDRGTNF